MWSTDRQAPLEDDYPMLGDTYFEHQFTVVALAVHRFSIPSFLPTLHCSSEVLVQTFWEGILWNRWQNLSSWKNMHPREGERERERQRERVCPAKSATLKYLFYMYFIYLKDKFKNVFFYSTYLTLREPKSPEAKPVPLVRELPSSRLFGQYHHCFDTHRWTLLLNCRKRHAHLFLRQQWEQRLSKPFGWLLWTFGFPKAFVTSAMNYGTWAIFIFINENLCFPPVIPQKSQFPSHQIGWGRMTVSPWVYLLSFLTVDTASPIL